MKRTLISTLIAGLLAGPGTQAAEPAQRCGENGVHRCCEGFCTPPAAPGNTLSDSLVVMRKPAALPPNVEVRQPDEVVVIIEGNAAAFPESAAAAFDEKIVVETAARNEKLNGVGFDSGVSLLTPDARQQLQALAARLAGKPNLRLAVVGHADAQRLRPRAVALYRDNLGLSEARAREAAALLQAQPGMAAVPVETSGKGASEPQVQCDDKQPNKVFQACLAPNRRTEVRVWYDQVSQRVERVARPAEPKPQPPAPPECAKAVGADAGLPFRISIDGEPMAAADRPNSADVTRCIDLALNRADIQVKFDSLALNPALNVWTYPVRPATGQRIEFLGYSNYVPWLQRAEVRIFEPGQSPRATPLAVLPLDWSKPAPWQPPANGREFAYLLRVYDARGRYDETTLKTLVFSQQGGRDIDTPERERNVGYGENALGLRNIPVAGGTVTVSGKGLPAGGHARALGLEVPVDSAGAFAIRQIMPTGPHTVAVEVEDAAGQRSGFERSLSIAADDWFYIAVADLTLGRNNVSGPMPLVTGDRDHEDQGTYVDGRGAFYLKGKIKGEWLLTAAADTREQPLQDLFSNFWSKDPRYLLRNIDPNRYYPVYGDDSTTVDDAPTQGKFYVKLQRGDSHILWGNFQTQWNGSELIQYSRGLYGANLRWRSEESTSFGEHRSSVDGFVADPGTAAARDEFRGTGGSLYYLRHQDITLGSERVWVEVRDKDSGLVLERKALAPTQDYEINYLQGRVTLREPLSSTAGSGGLVQTATLNGHGVYLVTTYEYVPGFDSLDGTVAGAHASHWVNDHLQVGATAYHQGESGAKLDLQGVEATLRYQPGTWVKAEVAQSRGEGSGALSSQDGGFDFNPLTADGRSAGAQRVEAAADLADLVAGGSGKLSAYAQHRDQGYSGPGQITYNNQALSQQGVRLDVPLRPGVRLSVKADAKQADSQDSDNLEIALAHQLTEQWKLSAGVRRDSRQTRVPNASPTLSADGARSDAVVRADFTPLDEAGQPEEWEAYGYLQATLERDDQRDDNNRGGLGASWRVTDALKASLEGSAGNGGPGLKLTGDYQLTDRSNAYLTYLIETENPDSAYRGRQSSVITGSHNKISDNASLFSETRRTGGAGPESLNHAFGLDLAPTERWTTGAKVEIGKVSDPLAGDLRRRAAGVSVGYLKERTQYSGNLEYRREHGDDNDDGSHTRRTTWLLRNTLGYQATPEWRLLAKGNFSFSSNSEGAFYDGEYREVVLAAAYRPVSDDRWNTLFKYTNFYNLPSPGQVDDVGNIADYAQKSQVLALDTIVDAKPWLALGAKYALRVGELKESKVGGDWYDSRADLLVLRADWHWVREWDAVAEWRRLDEHTADDARSGALLALYRHLADYLKVGVGYNFTDFSDDLTDLSYRSYGWFINVLATK